jgi:hypothetical protein
VSTFAHGVVGSDALKQPDDDREEELMFTPEPTPEQWFRGLSTEDRAAYRLAAQARTLTPVLWAKMVNAGVLAAVTPFTKVPDSTRYGFPAEYADFVLSQSDSASVPGSGEPG